MKIKYATLRLVIYAFLLTAGTALYGQTTYVWTNQSPAPSGTFGDLGISTNWNPTGPPNPANGDTAEWSEQTTGLLALTVNQGISGAAGQIVETESPSHQTGTDHEVSFRGHRMDPPGLVCPR